MRCKSCGKNWAVTGFTACRRCRQWAHLPRAGLRGVSLEARLWGRLRIVGECWEWDGALSASGYAGDIMKSGRKQPAYRWALILTVGEPPEGHEADHYCHNVICCRPEHLGWVTPSQNVGIRVRQPQTARRIKYNAYQRDYRARKLAQGKVRTARGAWVAPGSLPLAALRAAAALLPRP